MMPTTTYQLFRRAILARKQVTCWYGGCYRELCPHVLGHKGGQEKVLAYQFAGETTSTLPPGGEWRCFVVAKVRRARLRDGAWHSGASHSRLQGCVDTVDVDVNLPADAEEGEEAS